MSTKKITLKKNNLKNYFEELNLQTHLKLLTNESIYASKNKKIYLDCLNKEYIRPNRYNINNINTIKDTKKKSYSLYKSKQEKSPSNLYKKYASLSKNRKKGKIVLNCDENKSQKNKFKFNFLNEYASSKKILSNGSTRKSSDASPNDASNYRQYQQDIANFKKSFKFCSPNWKPIMLKNGHISLKNSNDAKKYTSLKNNLFSLNNSHSKSKEKNEAKKNRNSTINNQPMAISAKQNNFLNSNNICNTVNIKQDSIDNNNLQKQIPTLKLFDHNVSSSDSDSDSDEDHEEEEEEKELSNDKYENVGNKNMETELIIDSTFKISDDELSNELNECDAEKENHKLGIIEKKLLSFSKNKFEEKDKTDIPSQNNHEKIDISFKNMTPKLYLGTNKNNNISNTNKNIIISSVITMSGICDEKEKINQDSYLVKENIFKENYNIYGVFDGHGENGHFVSKYVSEYMNEYFTNKLNYILNEEENQNFKIENIPNIFLKNHNQIIKTASTKIDKELSVINDYDISQSGSTSIMLFMIKDTLICANIGDSQCYIFNCSSEDLWTFEPLSNPHLASDENEQKRILEKGGEVHPYYEQDGIFEGPDRIYVKNKVYPGLVMSRTFGDLIAKNIGVISEPEIITKKVDNNTKFIVLGSDGLWDALKPYDVNRIVRPFFNKGDIDGACQTLMKKAKQKWDKDKEERDDITIIVIFIGMSNNFILYDKQNSLKKIDEIDNDGK